MTYRLVSLFLLGLLFSNISIADQSNRYFLQPGDILSVSVWKEPDLQQLVLVRPDGGISFPLAGDMQVNHMSVEQLRAELATRLGKYIPDVQVSVALQELNGNQIYVMGKVNRPGVFPFVGAVDVVQALGMAGGMTTFADGDDIKILRRVENKVQAIPFRYSQVERGKKLEQNIVLQSGDTLIVP